MPWTCMGDWSYSSAFLDLGTRWKWVVSNMTLPLYFPRNEPPTNWNKSYWTCGAITNETVEPWRELVDSKGFWLRLITESQGVLDFVHLHSKELSVPETASVFVLRWKGRLFLGSSERTNFSHWAAYAEVEVNLRPTVSRPVCFGVGHPSGTRDQFFFLLEIFFRQLRVCYFVAPSLTRGRTCN
jgi:hypothetical protein